MQYKFRTSVNLLIRPFPLIKGFILSDFDRLAQNIRIAHDIPFDNRGIEHRNFRTFVYICRPHLLLGQRYHTCKIIEDQVAVLQADAPVQITSPSSFSAPVT